MKIQDVFESGREDDRAIIMQRHNELMKEIKDKQNKKIEHNENKDNVATNREEQETNAYWESLDRIKAAAIAAKIARGEDIAKAQEDFLSSKYPNMINDAIVVRNKLSNIIKKIESTKTKEEAEEVLQKLDPNLITLPFGDEKSTVFDKAVEIIKNKK